MERMVTDKALACLLGTRLFIERRISDENLDGRAVVFPPSTLTFIRMKWNFSSHWIAFFHLFLSHAFQVLIDRSTHESATVFTLPFSFSRYR